ncbi:MAG TPA: hypothetical protein VFY12_06090, partial [Arenimonas sp.]|nr:hypothetical protein [Arenimonas sp.]
MRIRFFVSIATLLLLSACASAPTLTVASTAPIAVPVTPGLDAHHFGEPLPVPPPASLFTLSAEQEADFLQYFHDPAHAGEARHRRLYDYLEQRLDHFRYYGATRSAAEALVADEGNCLTLAMLTTALARLADVEIAYLRISDEPVFERHGNVVFAADHVRSLLFDPDFQATPGEWVLQKPHLIIDYFPERRRRAGGRVSEQTLQSMFYTNLAGEAMAENRYREAFWLLKAALEQDPAHVGALNSLAVLHR